MCITEKEFEIPDSRFVAWKVLLRGMQSPLAKYTYQYGRNVAPKDMVVLRGMVNRTEIDGKGFHVWVHEDDARSWATWDGDMVVEVEIEPKDVVARGISDWMECLIVKELFIKEKSNVPNSC